MACRGWGAMRWRRASSARQLLETELPIFYRLDIAHCGIDGEEVRKHVGLAMTMGGGQNGLVLADVLGPRTEPVVVVGTQKGANVCHSCAMDPRTSLFELIELAPAGKESGNADGD